MTETEVFYVALPLLTLICIGKKTLKAIHGYVVVFCDQAVFLLCMTGKFTFSHGLSDHSCRIRKTVQISSVN